MPEETTIERVFKNVVISENGCWEWTGRTNSAGYSQVKIHGETHSGHRLVWEILNGEITGGLYVLHRCDNRKCVNPHHLFLGTNDDNMRDGAIKNRFVHKLSLIEIAEVRRLSIEGFTQVDISRMFNISQGHISKILNKKRRKHV